MHFIPFQLVSVCVSDNKSTLVHGMAWHQTGDQPLPKPMKTITYKIVFWNYFQISKSTGKEMMNTNMNIIPRRNQSLTAFHLRWFNSNLIWNLLVQFSSHLQPPIYHRTFPLQGDTHQMHAQFSWASAMHAKWADVILLLLIDGPESYMHAAICYDTWGRSSLERNAMKAQDEADIWDMNFSLGKNIFAKDGLHWFFFWLNHHKKLMKWI